MPKVMPPPSALDWYVREWDAIPQMPTVEFWRRTMARLHQRAAEQFGAEAAQQAWAQFRRNKGWDA